MQSQCFSKAVAIAIATGWLLSVIVPTNLNPNSIFSSSKLLTVNNTIVNVSSIIFSSNGVLVKYQKASKPKLSQAITIFNQQNIISQ